MKEDILYNGISMRDLFAIVILHAYCSNSDMMQASQTGSEMLGISQSQTVANMCYRQADAMMEKRKE